MMCNVTEVDEELLVAHLSPFVNINHVLTDISRVFLNLLNNNTNEQTRSLFSMIRVAVNYPNRCSNSNIYIKKIFF